MLNSSKKKKLLWIFFAISVLFNGIALVFLGGMLYKADLRDKTDVPYKADSSTPFQDKKIAFLGDSITYGFDPDNKGKQMKNPWVKQVGEKLQAQECLNYGVNSASVMDIKGTRMAAIGAYKQMNKDVDILGVMIGINDAYRKYPLGMFTDRTPDTFYGSLHLMWRGILKQYPPSSGKKCFLSCIPDMTCCRFGRHINRLSMKSLIFIRFPFAIWAKSWESVPMQMTRIHIGQKKRMPERPGGTAHTQRKKAPICMRMSSRTIYAGNLGAARDIAGKNDNHERTGYRRGRFYRKQLHIVLAAAASGGPDCLPG